MNDPSLEQIALGLTQLIVDCEKAAGKPPARADVFRTYAQCLRRTIALHRNFGPEAQAEPARRVQAVA